MQEQKANLVKSVPLFFDFPSLPHSAVVKTLLREILQEPLKPLTLEEVKKLRKQKLGRKRVYLTAKDEDLRDFFFCKPITLQYAVFLKLNQKLLEVKP
ncbi:hypothetical protein [uncultured virus]|uniref:Uncharacterized protein n=1 Tax=uncultured virus TaxID=340016 RepID=A0A5Q0TWK7_9VIRU|nr:hypothetical protein [uncultured virus]